MLSISEFTHPAEITMHHKKVNKTSAELIHTLFFLVIKKERLLKTKVRSWSFRPRPMAAPTVKRVFVLLVILVLRDT